MIMKVTLAFLLCLVTLTMGAPSPTEQEVLGAAVIENQPGEVAEVPPIESAGYAQPFEENESLEPSATHHKRYYYPHAYYYPHYYPHYYPKYQYPGYYHHYY